MMKLRLARTRYESDLQVHCDGLPAISAAAEIIGHLEAAGGQSLGAFLAEPVPAEGRGYVDWYARISGTAMPLVELQGGDRATAEDRLQFRLGQIRSIANAQPEGRLKRLLTAAWTYPGRESVFVIGQEPIMTQWGSRPAPTTVPAPQPVRAPVNRTAERSSAWLPVLGVLLTLALLAALGWVNRAPLLVMLTPQSPIASAPPPELSQALGLTAALKGEQKRSEYLRQQIAAFRQAFEAKKASCAAAPPPAPPPSPPATEQKMEGVPPPPPVKKVEEKPRPAAPKPEVVAAAPQSPKEEAPTPAQSCQAALQARKPWDAPEVVFVIDSSGSMAESVGGESRLDAAKQSVAIVADSLPGDVDTALVKFTACNEIDNDYFLPRDALKRKVNALSPEGGTPLARSIERAANILSKKKQTVMIVVTDGQDSCNQKDPCKVAAVAKASHPNLTINVVDVSGEGLGTCIARAGGGSVLPARTPAEIKAAIQQATLPATMPSTCRGGN